MNDSLIQAVFDNGKELSIDQSMLESPDIVKESKGEYHILLEGRSYRVVVDSYDAKMKEFNLSLNGKKIKLKLKEKLDLLIEEMGFKNIEEAAFKELNAPMPGLVVDVLVKQGQEIQKDENLIILEAMKMENIIKSDGHAIIKEVYVKAGDKVDKNQLLIELE